MASKRLIVGVHRSADLAEQHRLRLEADLDTDVHLISRRTRAGRYSVRGHVFTFEVQPPAPWDWLVTYRYLKAKHPRTVDFVAYRYTRERLALKAVHRYIRKYERWMLRIDWDDEEISQGPRSREARASVERR